MTNMTNENGNKKLREDRIIAILIAAPIIIGLLIAGGPAIWKGITSIAKVIFPSGWVIAFYIYIAVLSFLIGRISSKKK